MPSYRPPISRDEYHYLEVYYFKLVQFSENKEFWLLTDLERGKIAAEIAYISMALDILGRLFNPKGKNEKAVMAWPYKPEEEAMTLYRFSCIAVAAEALGCNKSKISAVCKGKRHSTGGYVFQYEDEYNDAHSDISIDEYLNRNHAKEETPSADGDV